MLLPEQFNYRFIESRLVINLMFRFYVIAQNGYLLMYIRNINKKNHAILLFIKSYLVTINLYSDLINKEYAFCVLIIKDYQEIKKS